MGEQMCFSVEEVAPVLGVSPTDLRKYMRIGAVDLGLALNPKTREKENWHYKVYRPKLEKLIGTRFEECRGKKIYMSSSEAAQILKLNATDVRRFMRAGDLDLGLALSPKCTGLGRWKFKVYLPKLEKVLGGSVSAGGENHGTDCSG